MLNLKTKIPEQNIWDTMKRQNLRLGTEKREESQVKGTENIFSKILEENLTNLRKKYKKATEHQIDRTRKEYSWHTVKP